MALTSFAAEGLLRVAYLLESLPDNKFDLSDWYSPGERGGCGTTYCAMGLAGTERWFQRRGLRLDRRVHEVMFKAPDGQRHAGFYAVAAFFGIEDDAAFYLFAPGRYDTHSPTRSEVIKRIRDFVATDGDQDRLPDDDELVRLTEQMAALSRKMLSRTHRQLCRVLAQAQGMPVSVPVPDAIPEGNEEIVPAAIDA